jgi:signal transduction histidine kinase
MTVPEPRTLVRRLARPPLAWSLTVATLAMFAAFAVLFYSPLTPPVLFAGAGGVLVGFFVFPFLPLAVAGGFLAVRRPDNPLGWTMALSFFAYMVGVLCTLLDSLLAFGHSGAAPWVALGASLWTTGFGPAGAGMCIGLVLFPDGHLPSRWWRWLPWTALALLVIGVGFVVVDPSANLLTIAGPMGNLHLVSPLAIAGEGSFDQVVQGVVQPLGWALSILALISVFLRLRGADGERRHQIRWFATGALVTLALVVPGSLLPNSFPHTPSAGQIAVVGVLMVVGSAAIPIALTVAILRYRLYDIDIVISRALVYGSLAVFITGIYVGIAVGIGELVGSGGKPNLGLSILATAIVAVGFQPARERMQRLANRLVYGRRATPYEVLSQFSSRVAESYAGEEVLARMAGVLQQGTGAEAATVWLKRGGELRPAATHPDDLVGYEPRAMADGVLPELPGASRVVAVMHQGEVLGALSVVKRRGEVLSPLEEKLLSDLAQQAGLVLKNVGLTAQLQARLEELRLSRQRLVSAQDEARRRLERNLHDGAQQHLVALKVKLGLAEMLLARDAEKAKATLRQLKSDADEALETLRDLARGIYPPLLADKGLVAALESQARKATVPVTVEAEGVGRYPQEVEATVYFCCLEALQNVQKYAQASRVSIRLGEDQGTLGFEVSDDGQGFDPATVRRGAGLTNMQDRLDALGGSVALASQPGRGTTISGAVPVGSPIEAPVAGGLQPAPAPA